MKFTRKFTRHFHRQLPRHFPRKLSMNFPMKLSRKLPRQFPRKLPRQFPSKLAKFVNLAISLLPRLTIINVDVLCRKHDITLTSDRLNPAC